MKAEQLSVAEMLKHSRHDFLNDLQLILMNLDLGNPEKARETILQTTKTMRQHSFLDSLNLPKTALWLTTLEWVHTAFTKSLSCQVKAPIIDVDDEDLVLFLEQTIERTNQFVDVFSEYEAFIHIFSIENEWKIEMVIQGKLPTLESKETVHATFICREMYEENIWKFTMRGQ